MKYEILLFDLDHTLLDFDKSEDIALRQFLKNENVLNIEEYILTYSKINKKMWEDLEKGLITRKELVNNRFSELFSFYGIEKDGEELALKYQEILGLQGHEFYGAEDLLNKLSNNYHIYAATNGITYIQKLRLKHSNISKYFKKVYISEEIGYNKPNKKFFEFIQKDLKFDKEKVLMIGDNLFADIKGALDFGIDAMWLNNNNNCSEIEIKPTYIVKNYNEILEKLL